LPLQLDGSDRGARPTHRPVALPCFLFAQAGRVWDQAPKPSYAVIVAVVDSEPEDGEGAPYIDHASAMADIIETLACPWDSCNIEIYRALGLPLLETGQVRSDGGYYGARAHVAMGIVESVNAWREALANGAESRLVINLSLGWVTDDGMGGCGTGDSEPWCENGTNHVGEFESWIQTASALAYSTEVANEAVHAALLYATCQGALVVAAAGNAKDDSCNQTQVAPAVWSRYASPTAAECALLEFEPPTGASGTLYDVDRPLVQPMSAIDHGDGPIFATRPGSETRLVGPGHMVTTGDTMAPLSGTSVPTAVASAAAAILWSYDPEPSPGAVIDRLYTTGLPIDRTSMMDESGWGVNVAMRRLSICRALDPTCEDEGPCESSYCYPEDSISMVLDELRNEVEQQVNQLSSVSVTVSGLYTESCWSCGEQIVAMMPNTSNPEDYYYFSSCTNSPANFVPMEGSMLAGPQPDVPLCPDCPFVASEAPDASYALLALDSWYWNKAIQGLTMIVRRSGYPGTVIDLTATPNR